MPDGHTIHRAARDQSRDFAGHSLRVSSPQGRFAREARRLDRRTLERIEPYGKHLFYWWEGGRITHVHLGLYGRFRRHAAPPPEPRETVRVRLISHERSLDLIGPAACELLDAKGRDTIIARLGQDPLLPQADVEAVWRRVSRSRAPLGTLLLNQSVFAGVGNIFRAESLFAIGAHPTREGRSLDRDTFDQLWAELVRTMKQSARLNRIVTATPEEVGKPISRMKKNERLRIYAKQSCTRCGGPVDRWEQAARTIYACAKCQG
ncbi:MAG: DNA-formamidopyrimidine glycosylase family protein [Planctomycetota bacterium]|nr:DNA-formamidopyrimidine glycosylase family protein [Planctomycetota bacterium]